jgi:nucleoside-diphosphate-sugar epimerase
MSTQRRVLVTGSSGFVGGHLFDRFQSMGWEVTGVGRRPIAHPSYVAHDLARPLPFEGSFDVVVHAAARASPWGRLGEFRQQNVVATKQVIDHCVAHGLPKLVFISSSSVFYTAGHQLGITEETPMPAKAVNDYAATKREAEELVRRYPGDWAILRPRAVFGPRDTVLLPRILEAARKGKLPLLTTKDDPAVGDLIYIDNLTDCIVRAAADDGIRGCFNLTNNEPVAIQDFLFDLFRRLGLPRPGRRVPVGTAMFAAGAIELVHRVFLPWKEPPITRFGIHVFAYSKTFDVSKMLAAMGPPRVSLAEGLERTVAWIRSC